MLARGKRKVKQILRGLDKKSYHKGLLLSSEKLKKRAERGSDLAPVRVGLIVKYNESDAGIR